MLGRTICKLITFQNQFHFLYLIQLSTKISYRRVHCHICLLIMTFSRSFLSAKPMFSIKGKHPFAIQSLYLPSCPTDFVEKHQNFLILIPNSSLIAIHIHMGSIKVVMSCSPGDIFSIKDYQILRVILLISLENVIRLSVTSTKRLKPGSNQCLVRNK